MNRRKFTGMGRQIAAQQRAQPQMPMGGGIGAALGRIGQRPGMAPVDRGFIDRMPRMNVPEGPPPAGMAPVDPSKAMMMKKGGAVKKMAKGGKLTDLTGDGKVTRADVLKGRGVPGFSKGGTASKRADGCATKGKTKGRFV